MKRTTILLMIANMLLYGSCKNQLDGNSQPALAASGRPPVLLAIFAHPDDELLTGATLAHYASQGVKVYVVIATDGSLGTTDFSSIPAGRELAEARYNEMICSAKTLGIEPPIFVGLSDQFQMATGRLEDQIDSLRRFVTAIFMKLEPNVIVTFGAEAWTGHPDHRLVGSIVTEVFASRHWPNDPRLYYPALPTGSITSDSWAQYLTVDSTYLTARIPLSPNDYEKLRAAYNCHQTQYRESVRKRLPVFIEETQHHIAMFRPFWPEKGIQYSLFKPARE